MEKSEFENYIKAGKIAKQVKEFAKENIKPKMKLIEIANLIDDKIIELGGMPAFPVNLSLNEIAAHYTPTTEDQILAEGILKVDIGVHINGCIADTAFSIDLSGDKKFKDMIELNEKILQNISSKVSVGMKIKEVGETAQETLEEWNEEKKDNYSIIKSLSGHELGNYKIHAGLTISNYRNDNSTELRDAAVAIEPFVTTGVGDVYEGAPGGIYVLKRDEKPRDKDSRELLEFIKNEYQTLPFCLRWLEKAGFKKLKFILSSLVRNGILYEYPLLIEKSKAPVSQAENTFIIYNEKVVCTTI